jgi:hypothetical protein
MCSTVTGDDLQELRLKRLEESVRKTGRVRVSFLNAEYFIWVVDKDPQGPHEIAYNSFVKLRQHCDNVFETTLLAQKFLKGRITQIAKVTNCSCKQPVIENDSKDEDKISNQLNLF